MVPLLDVSIRDPRDLLVKNLRTNHEPLLFVVLTDIRNPHRGTHNPAVTKLIMQVRLVINLGSVQGLGVVIDRKIPHTGRTSDDLGRRVHQVVVKVCEREDQCAFARGIRRKVSLLFLCV